MNFSQVVGTVWKRRWVVLLIVLLSAGASTAFALSRAKVYESTATLVVLPNLLDQQGGSFLTFEAVTSLVETYAEAAESPRNVRRAERILGRPIRSDVSATVLSDTGILRVHGRDASPQVAAKAAQAVATAFQQSLSGLQPLDVTLLDAATVPTEPVQPRPPLIIAVGTVLGIGVAILAALSLERVRRRIETAQDLVALTDAPVIGRLPTARRLSRADRWLVWDMDELVQMQEAFRALRTNLDFLGGPSLKALQITSPLPSEGKSTVAANLAVAFAKTGVETVVIDCDMRRPTQHRIFRVDNTEGLSSMLALRHRRAEPQPTQYPLLSVLPSGPLPPNSTEILHIRFKAVIEQLSRRDGVLIIDSPPILPVSDARLIAPYMDGVLTVLSAGRSKPAEAAAAFEQLALTDSNLLGVVLNRASEDPGGHLGYYGKYEPESRRTGPSGGSQAAERGGGEEPALSARTSGQ